MNVVIWNRIPKTGSTSLHQRLNAECLGEYRTVGAGPLEILEFPRAILLAAGHVTPEQVVSSSLLAESTIRRSFVFTVIRNPWARFASLWFGIGREYRWTDSFEEWLLRSLSDESITASEEGTPVGYAQDRWLLLDGLPVSELVLRMERLEEEWPALAARLGVPDVPLSVANAHRHPPYTDIYTPDAIQAVEEAEQYVIQRYGYRFGDDTKDEIPRVQEASR